MTHKKPAQTKGVAHIIAATGYSLSGLRILAKEPSFRQEMLAGVAGFALLLGFGASANSLAGFVILICLLLATEAVNTALEAVVDHLSPEWSAFGKQVKDLGSAAVFLVIIANVVYLLVTLVPLILT